MPCFVRRLIDVAYVKLHTSKYAEESRLDSLKQAAGDFYSCLDKNPISNKDVREILADCLSCRFIWKTTGTAWDNGSLCCLGCRGCRFKQPIIQMKKIAKPSYHA